MDPLVQAETMELDTTSGVRLSLEELGIVIESIINASVERQEEEDAETPEEENLEDGDDSMNEFDSSQLGPIIADPTEIGGMFPQNALLL